MFRGVKLWFALAVAAALVAPAGLQAQQPQKNLSRYKVLIPDFFPEQGADRDFGKDAATRLRSLMDTLLTHEAIPRKEIEKSLKQYDLKWEDLNCIRTRQLASRIGAQVALCASYAAQGAQQYTVNAAFWDIASNEAFEVPAVTAGKNRPGDAAKQIFDQFDQYNQQVRATRFCSDYAQSQQWDEALAQCDKALALNPAAVGTRYQRGFILWQMNRYEEALAELQKVLEENPVHEDALRLAGYISAELGHEEQARKYYTQYLELNPDNVQVRMKIAYDLAQAGDPVGAMQLIQEGLDVNPDNVDLLEQYGGFAFSAGQKVNSEQSDSTDNGGEVSPEAAEYFHKAIDAYLRVFQAKGADTPAGELRNVIGAYIQLSELDKAIATAEEALKTHPEAEEIWSFYADALNRAKRLDDALAALDRLKALNPDYPNLQLRRGKWLIAAGRVDDALDVLSEAALAHPEQADQAASLLFSQGYNEGIKKNRYDLAATTMAKTRNLPNLSQEMKHQLNFWQGYAVFQAAVEEQKPSTLATARSTLPKFRRALELLGDVGDYPQKLKVKMAQLLKNVGTYIEIQEAIIKRGR